MTSGGARARSGPAPDPNALRRARPSDQATWTRLPAAGRGGDPPPHPFSRPTARERAMWAQEWRRPQALMWEANGQQLVVALYIRAVLASVGPKATAGDRTAVIRYLDDLGISNGGLAKNRWVIDDAGGSGSAAGQDDSPRPAAGASAKERLRLVAG